MFQFVRFFTQHLPLIAFVPLFFSEIAAADDIRFDKTQLCLAGERVVDVEIAETAAQQRQGLMFRESLSANAGMLFVYQSSEQRSFWMMNTRIPLDIAYINEEGHINEILTMQPCESRLGFRCPSYPSEGPFRYALEMNAGWFEQSRVGEGDQLTGGDCKTPLADWLINRS